MTSGSFGARNDAVLHDVVGRDASHGGEGGFAAFPDDHALGFRLRDANLPRAACGADLANVPHQFVDFGLRAVEFDEQQSAAIGISGVHGGFGGLDGELVHHFDRGGQHSGGDDVR